MTPRHTWMDTLRGLAILFIVGLHSVALPAILSGVPSPHVFQYLIAAVTPYRMPMLMILSGMLLGRALAKRPWPYALGKIRTLVWPYLIWVSVYFLVTAPSAFPSWEEWIATSWLWYIFFLAAYFAIAPVLVHLPLWLTPILLWTASAIVPDVRWTEFFLYAGYFFAGHALWQNRDRLRRFDRPWVAVAAALAAVVLAAGYVLQERGVTFLVPLRNEELIYAPATLVGVGALILLARRIPERFTAVLRFFGRNSVVFYLVHFPIQILVTTLLGEAWLWDWRLHVGLGFGLALAVGAVLVALRRFAVVDALFVMPWPGSRRAADGGRRRRRIRLPR